MTHDPTRNPQVGDIVGPPDRPHLNREVKRFTEDGKIEWTDPGYPWPKTICSIQHWRKWCKDNECTRVHAV